MVPPDTEWFGEGIREVRRDDVFYEVRPQET